MLEMSFCIFHASDFMEATAHGTFACFFAVLVSQVNFEILNSHFFAVTLAVDKWTRGLKSTSQIKKELKRLSHLDTLCIEFFDDLLSLINDFDEGIFILTIIMFPNLIGIFHAIDNPTDVQLTGITAAGLFIMTTKINTIRLESSNTLVDHTLNNLSDILWAKGCLQNNNCITVSIKFLIILLKL